MFPQARRGRCVLRLRVIRPVWACLLLAASAAAQTAIPTRDQIPAAYRWDLTRIYADAEAWERDVARARDQLGELEAHKAAALDAPAVLRAVLELRDDVRWRVDKVAVYANQLLDQDTRDSAAAALKNRATALQTAYSKAAAWIEPALLALPEARLREWLAADAGLRVYTHYVDNVLRQRPHTLSQREEELLALAGGLAAAPEDAFQALRNSELPWPTMRDESGTEVVLSPARFDKFIRATDRRVRADAFRGAMGAYGAFRNTFAATLNGVVQRDLYYARARGFDTALDAVLFPDNLPTAVYENLVGTVNRHLPLLHRWARLRKELLGLDELHIWDTYQPLVSGATEQVPYDEAVRQIIAALQPLGPEYGRRMEEGFRSRWVDVYETQGKRPGGYSWGSYDTPPYILVNYNGTPRDRSILAHELGHSMHSLLTHTHQPKIYGDYSGTLAEVAAIFNEILLEEWLRQHAPSQAERLRLLNEQIDNLRGTVFRQVMFAEFEHAMHETARRGDALTAEKLGQLYVDTVHKYWGPELVRDPEHAPYWARIPHFYMNHYVFRYALAYCAAAALAERVLAGEPGALEAYLGFLKSGSSEYPLETLRRAGVDLTSPAPIEATMRRFERLVTEFEKERCGQAGR